VARLAGSLARRHGACAARVRKRAPGHFIVPATFSYCENGLLLRSASHFTPFHFIPNYDTNIVNS